MSRDLTLARLISRVDVHPKSLEYHSNRIPWGGALYPSKYDHWEINQKSLTLRNTDGRTEVSSEGGFVALRADRPEDVDAIRDECVEVFESFLADVAPNAKPVRFGWRTTFVTEGSSFDELFPEFRKGAARHEKDWMRIGSLPIRDLGYVNVHYGTPLDGLNLSTGVFTPEQVGPVNVDAEKFTVHEDSRLDIANGCLMIDLDRYVAGPDGIEPRARIRSWHEELMGIAQRLVRDLLK